MKQKLLKTLVQCLLQEELVQNFREESLNKNNKLKGDPKNPGKMRRGIKIFLGLACLSSVIGKHFFTVAR